MPITPRSGPIPETAVTLYDKVPTFKSPIDGVMPRIANPTGHQIDAVLMVFALSELTKMAAYRANFHNKPEYDGVLDAPLRAHFQTSRPEPGYIETSMRQIFDLEFRADFMALAQTQASAFVAHSPADIARLASGDPNMIRKRIEETNEERSKGSVALSLDSLARLTSFNLMAQCIAERTCQPDDEGICNFNIDGATLTIGQQWLNAAWQDIGEPGALSLKLGIVMPRSEASHNVFDAVRDIMNWANREIRAIIDAPGDNAALLGREENPDNEDGVNSRASVQLSEAVDASYHPECECDRCTEKREADNDQRTDNVPVDAADRNPERVPDKSGGAEGSGPDIVHPKTSKGHTLH